MTDDLPPISTLSSFFFHSQLSITHTHPLSISCIHTSGAYYHPDFVKGDRLRTHKITRTKAPKKAPVRSNKNLNQAKAQPRSRGSSGSPRKSKKPTASSRSDSSSRKSSRTPTSAKNADVNRNNSNSNSIKRSASAGDAYLVDPFAFDACNPSSHIDLSIPENSVHRNSAKNVDNGDDQSSSFVVPHTADYCESKSKMTENKWKSLQVQQHNDDDLTISLPVIKLITSSGL